MRKKIALFGNGWSDEYLLEVGEGIESCTRLADTDVFAFINYSAFVLDEATNDGEMAVFALPDLKDFDGAIICGNTLNTRREMEYLYQKILSTGIPCVSLEVSLEGMSCVKSDNYSGMFELTRHLIQRHGARDIVFVGGTADHTESEIRLKAVRDASFANGVIIPDDHIFYGEWNGEVAGMKVKAWLEQYGKLPDVFICANDMMAMGVCNMLQSCGYNVPRDVLVTGYDYTKQGQNFRPMLTSVNKNAKQMGMVAIRLLFDMMDGKCEYKEILQPSTPNFCESCGCIVDERTIHERLNRICSEEKHIDPFTADGHFRMIYQAVRKEETLEGLQKALSCVMTKEHGMEGEEFSLVLSPAFFQVDKPNVKLDTCGYPEQMQVVCSLHEGQTEPVVCADKTQILFDKAGRMETPGVYMFVTVRSDAKVYGYAMMSGGLNSLESKNLYLWTRHMNQYMEQVRSNIRIAELTRQLSELSVKDGLTGVYNRNGCQQLVYPFIEKNQASGRRTVVIMVDVDRMKNINDKYGHAAGDIALQLVSELLITRLPDYKVVRFGGDEFLVAGDAGEDFSAEETHRMLTEELRSMVTEREIEFPLTASFGISYLQVGEVFDPHTSLQKADGLMYMEKDIHHRKS